MTTPTGDPRRTALADPALADPAPAPGTFSRRSMLAASAVTLAACAGCGSGSAGGTPSTSASSPAPSAARSSGGSGAGTSATGGSATPLAKVSDIPAGSGLVAIGPNGPVLLAESGGRTVAHTAVCTHQGATVDGAGVCPLHGSKFDVTTGVVRNGPATSPLATVAVTVTDGKVFLA